MFVAVQTGDAGVVETLIVIISIIIIIIYIIEHCDCVDWRAFPLDLTSCTGLPE